jgi:hypothetical protein
MCETQNHSVWWLSIIQNCNKLENGVLEIESVSAFRWGEGDTYSV